MGGSGSGRRVARGVTGLRLCGNDDGDDVVTIAGGCVHERPASSGGCFILGPLWMNPRPP